MENNNNLKIEKETSKVNLSSTGSIPDTLKEKFSNIDKKYSQELSTWKQKQDALTLTDQQAQEKASDNLSDYYNTSVGKIEDKYQTSQDKIDQSKNLIGEKYSTKSKKAEENYAEDKEDLRFDSIEKGWRVSSIYDNELKNLESEYESEKSKLESEKQQQLDALSFKQTVLEEEMEKALENFDITYAQKLSTEIEKVKKEFDKANKTEKQNADQQVENITLNIGREKTAEVLKYLSGKTKAESQQFLQDNPSLKDELGQSWFNALSAWVEKR